MEKPTPRQRSRRRFDYDRRLLPNPLIAELEPAEATGEDDVAGSTDWSLGFPAWNLLYYSLYCSLFPEQENVAVLETGTNRGVSTIVMAQALEDLGVEAVVDTVELDPELAAVARDNVERAGLSSRVRFHVEDAVGFLSRMAEERDHFDFVLLDDKHTFQHVLDEIKVVCPRVTAPEGKVYFDNTGWGGVTMALAELRKLYGGNLVQFDNCSWRPPGNAIWQPSSPPRYP